MINKSIYEVTRDEYKGFVDIIKPNAREIKIEDIGTIHIAAKIYNEKLKLKI